MEEKLKVKFEQFKKSVLSFQKALSINIDKFESFEQDVVKNGQIQKFEIASEQMWKIVKYFLNENFVLLTGSPKSVMKMFFENGYVNYSQYECTIEILADRNKLSHIYQEEMFNEVHGNLQSHLQTMLVISKIIDENFE